MQVERLSKVSVKALMIKGFMRGRWALALALHKKDRHLLPAMIHINPHTRYFQLRLVSAAFALVAMLAAMSGVAGSATVLVWAVALISLTVFGASFYLKS